MTVSGVTSLTVRARPSANAAPTIPAQSIEVFENTDGTIGTVTASDDDELIFSMAMGDELNLDGDPTEDDDQRQRKVHDYGQRRVEAGRPSWTSSKLQVVTLLTALTNVAATLTTT